MKISTDANYSVIYDGSNDPNTNFLTISSFNSQSLAINTNYIISIRARNIIELGTYSGVLSVILGNFPSSANSIITGLTQLFSGYVSTVKIKVTKIFLFLFLKDTFE